VYVLHHLCEFFLNTNVREVLTQLHKALIKCCLNIDCIWSQLTNILQLISHHDASLGELEPTRVQRVVELKFVIERKHLDLFIFAEPLPPA
jgi:hypothetical protein